MTPAAEVPAADHFKMTLSEHLGELRTRLMRCTISVLVLGGASLIFARSLYGLLMRPVLLALPPDANSLVYTSAIEEVNVYMKVGLYAGVFLTTPVILWQIWGFVSPGLYDQEKKLAGPFIIFGTLSFLAGAVFCYLVLLPQMFQFLLRQEGSMALEGRLKTGKLREEDAIRYLRLGDVERAGALAKATNVDLEADGEGQAKAEGQMGITLLPKQNIEALNRLDGLGRLIDAVMTGYGPPSRVVLATVMEKRSEAVKAFGEEDWSKVTALSDEAAALLAGVDAAHTTEFSQLWLVVKNLATGQAAYDSKNWTRPMLSMTEQLTLVLVLELAFGVIFELPLVMALLALVGLVKSSFLFKYQRHAFVVCLIAAAVLTPTGDAVNLALMAGPMLACYEIGVVLVWIIEKRRKNREASAPPVA